jgi:hypothetical protein
MAGEKYIRKDDGAATVWMALLVGFSGSAFPRLSQFLLCTYKLTYTQASVVAANNRETKFHLLESIKSPFIHHFSLKPPSLVLKSPRHIKSSDYDGQYLFFIRCNKNFIAQSPTRAFLGYVHLIRG